MQDLNTLDLTGPALDWVIANLLTRQAVYRLHQNSIGASVYRTEGLHQAGISFAPGNPGVTYAKDVWPILTNPAS
ncbi:hypothetical protein [Chitinilyticum aquatile]|uniref:hypothetical protein n=1 Tax=Chitinilyticum aquatile TaxID=362520 RepID=UPI0012DE737E|nr:hypothetical protein [Chitinilyticum aquatile]